MVASPFTCWPWSQCNKLKDVDIDCNCITIQLHVWIDCFTVESFGWKPSSNHLVSPVTATSTESFSPLIEGQCEVGLNLAEQRWPFPKTSLWARRPGIPGCYPLCRRKRSDGWREGVWDSRKQSHQYDWLSGPRPKRGQEETERGGDRGKRDVVFEPFKCPLVGSRGCQICRRAESPFPARADLSACPLFAPALYRSAWMPIPFFMSCVKCGIYSTCVCFKGMSTTQSF